MPGDPIRSILVGVDLHADAEAIIRTAGELAVLAGARLHLLYAFDLQPLPNAAETTSSGFQAQIAEARARLAALADRAVPAAAEVGSREVVIYVAHKAILDRAAQVEADLIVLGPHRARGVGDRFLGTTANRIIRMADVPCLVVPDGITFPLRRILAPIDLSEPSRAALDVAVAWGLAFGAPETEPARSEVRIVHVIPRVFDFGDLPVEGGAAGPDLESEVERAAARAGGAGRLDLRQEVVWADSPAPAIVRYAQENAVDLLVLATHGYGALKRAVLGSVTSAVLRDSPCPVLVVPPRLQVAAEP